MAGAAERVGKMVLTVEDRSAVVNGATSTTGGSGTSGQGNDSVFYETSSTSFADSNLPVLLIDPRLFWWWHSLEMRSLADCKLSRSFIFVRHSKLLV